MAQHLKPWHIRRPQELSQIRQDLLAEFPHLHVFIESSTVFVRGTFPLRHEGEFLDEYLIEVEFPTDYPTDLPVVREKGDRIPRTADHHINNQRGDICLFVPDERWRIFPEGSSFLDFLRVPVYNYFLSESLVALGQPRPFGERAHGVAGIVEYYAEELSTSDLSIILKCIEALSRAPVRGHWPCFCGSGKKLRKCHLMLMRSLQDKVPSGVARKSLAALRKVRR